MNDDELQNIMVNAISYNSSKQITGSLIHYDDIFFQIIEGQENEVLSLMDKIRKDPRHTSIEIEWTSRIKQRKFDSWSMRLVEFENLTPTHQTLLLDYPKAIDDQKPNAEVINILASIDY